MRKRLEYVGGRSAKFWQIAQEGTHLTVTFGRIGTDGQTQLRSFDSAEAAAADAHKQMGAKLKKGYAEVADAKAGATKGGARGKTAKANGAAVAKDPHPFLFVGQGFGTSYKCLECYAWFVRAPSAGERKWIVAHLPLPLTSFAKFDGDLLHFGSDDLLETYVKAAHDPTYTKMPFKKAVAALDVIAEEQGFHAKATLPTTKQWSAFCDGFERAMNEIHAKTRLRLALKPDDEPNTGLWHRWSVKESYRLAELALGDGRRPTSMLSGLFMNLLESVLPEGGTGARRLAPSARRAWLSWLDVLITKGDRDLRDEFVDRAMTLVESFPNRERAELVNGLSPSTRRALAEDSEDRD